MTVCFAQITNSAFGGLCEQLGDERELDVGAIIEIIQAHLMCQGRLKWERLFVFVEREK